MEQGYGGGGMELPLCNIGHVDDCIRALLLDGGNQAIKYVHHMMVEEAQVVRVECGGNSLPSQTS
jgi:hypothetical protein